MAKGDYLGEFEQMVLLALLRLEDKAYGVTIRREIQGRSDRRVAIGAVYATLERLDQGGNQSRALRIFEKRLLECLGYGLNLAQTAGDGQPVDASRHYTYQVECGPQLSVAENAASYAGRSLLSLAGEDLTDARSLQDARRLLRHTLDFYLGDKPLKSRKILYSMRSW